jgi:hypothetical protein
MKKVFLSILVIGIITFFTQCKKDAIDQFDCSGITPTYTTNVKAILDTRCSTSGCHSASKKAAGIDLSNYSSASAESKKGRFLGSIQHKSGYDAMPKGSSKLDDATIKIISCWVQNGSPE